MATMYENVCGNCVVRIEFIVAQKIVKSMVEKKNQMHAYEMSYKCQLYPTHTVAT
jgi:hypothetical protein